jgi:hypothetical protein
MKVAEGICWFYKLTQRRFLPSGKEPTYLTTSVQADLCDRLKEKHGKAGLSQFTIRQSGRRSDSDCEIGDVHGIPQPVTFLLLVSVGFLIGHFFCSPSNFCWRINKCVPCIFCSSKFCSNVILRRSSASFFHSKACSVCPVQVPCTSIMPEVLVGRYSTFSPFQ